MLKKRSEVSAPQPRTSERLNRAAATTELSAWIPDVMSSRRNQVKKFGFDPGQRVKKRREFLEIQKLGKRLHSKHLLIYVLNTKQAKSRVGITVSKKVDTRSVARNLLRRRLREIYRLNRARLKNSFDIIIIARSAAQSCTYEDLRRELLGALRHSGCLN